LIIHKIGLPSRLIMDDQQHQQLMNLVPSREEGGGTSRGGHSRPHNNEKDEQKGASSLYCHNMPCVEKELSKLHSSASKNMQAVPDALVDRYLYLCSIVDYCPTKPTSKNESQIQQHKQTMRVTCLCGNPKHSIVLDKERVGFGSDSCFPFDTSHISRNSARNKNSSKNQVVESVVPASCFLMELCDTIRFETLPDLGMYIRFILQRRYYTPSTVKHFRRCAKLLDSRLVSPCRAQQSQQQQHGGGDNTNDETPVPIAFAEGFIDGLCCTLLQDSIPCMKKAKRSIKSNVFQTSPTNAEITACINILHGTLLSLYPRAVRRPTFSARVPMSMRIHRLLCASRDQQLDFLKKYPSLVRLCFMEYFVNFLVEFMPAERDLLCQTNSMKLYITVCQTACDSFRSETLCTGLESWEDLDKLSGSFIDRCIRMCKFKMYRTQEPVFRVQQTSLLFRKGALDLPCTYGCMPLLQQLVDHKTTEEAVLQCAIQLQTMLTTHPLPLAITQMQIASMGLLHSSCCKRSFAVCHCYVCCVCSLSGRGINTPMRLCSETGEISCVSCPPGSVVCINMIGVLLKVCNTTYYMCPCCTRLKLWNGDGDDLCPGGLEKGCRCATSGGGGRHHLMPQISSVPWQHPRIGCHPNTMGDNNNNKFMDRCAVCTSKHTGNHAPIYVPDPKERMLRRVVLCSRHRPPEYIMRNIWSYQELQKAVFQHSASKSTIGGSSGNKIKALSL
jgi:hypothetical protein